MIFLPQTFAASEVRIAHDMQLSHVVDSTLLEHQDFGSRTEQGIGEHDVAGSKDVSPCSKQGRLALALPGIATNCQINHGAARKRDDGGDPSDGESQPGF